MAILFQSVTVLPMDGGRKVLRDAFVAVEGERITHVGPTRPAGDFERVVDCAGLVMLPGFVNAHTHLPMTLMRGYGGGCDLHTWLNDYIFPAEARLDDKSVAAGTALGLAEMIASGVTCVVSERTTRSSETSFSSITPVSAFTPTTAPFRSISNSSPGLR